MLEKTVVRGLELEMTSLEFCAMRIEEEEGIK